MVVMIIVMVLVAKVMVTNYDVNEDLSNIFDF